MKITMDIISESEMTDRVSRVENGVTVWHHELAFPLAPVSSQPPEGETETQVQAAMRMLTPKTDGLGPDGDYPECRGDFAMDDVICDTRSFDLLLYYPLGNPVCLRVEDIAPGAFTPKMLCEIVRDAYIEIYRLEENGADIPTSQDMPGSGILLNRPSTDGMFGIFGHGISDLVIEVITVVRESDVNVIVDLGIGS